MNKFIKRFFLVSCLLICYDKSVDDSLQPIIDFIKQRRTEGMEDVDIEQQLLIGSWTEQDIRTGRNFLLMTRKTTLVDDLRVKDILQKEESLRKHQSLMKLIFKRVLPITIILAISVGSGFFLYDFIYVRIFKQANTTSSPTPSSSNENAVSQNSALQPPPASSIIDNEKSVTIKPNSQIKIRGMVICTKDIKTCPNGNMVGRTAPSCEFALCPP